MKYFLVALFLLISANLSPAQAGIDICLEITGTTARAWTALNEVMTDDGDTLPKRDVTRGITVDVWDQPVLSFGKYDSEGKEIVASVFNARPIMRIRFSREADTKAREKIGEFDENGDWVPVGALPVGLDRVPCPTTRVWM